MKQINMRDYSITKRKGEWYNAEAIDSYGNKYQNYFETYVEAGEWIFYSQELLYKAIQQCKEIDENKGITKIM